MYIAILLLLTMITGLNFASAPSASRTEMLHAKAAATAGQMLVAQQAAVAAQKASPGYFQAGVMMQAAITEPTWFDAAAKFASGTDGATVVVTYFGGDNTLWQDMLAALGQQASAYPTGGRGGAVLAGALVQGASGPYLQVQGKMAAQIALPPAAVSGAPSGAPAIVSLLN